MIRFADKFSPRSWDTGLFEVSAGLLISKHPSNDNAGTVIDSTGDGGN
jgi:hypothetical protein